MTGRSYLRLVLTSLASNIILVGIVAITLGLDWQIGWKP